MTAPRLPLRHRLAAAMREFLAQNASSGVILMAVAGLALAIANSPLAADYFHTLHLQLGPMSLGHWINDGLMAVFFLLVGLEIKREFIAGELSTWPRRVLPGAAALGGMIAPALIYLAVNAGHPDSLRGWAIPAATDIAFALGVLSLLGDKAPVSLKIFLTALAILDDLGAVVIIALFYTADLNTLYLASAGGVFALLLLLNRLKVKALLPYLALGVALWVFVYLSGIHATLAGVLLALTIPLKNGAAEMEAEHTPLHRLEHAISPWVAFLIVPIFGFANAGVSLSEVTLGNLVDPTPLGVAAGLFIGKQIGVFGASWLMIRFNIADLPAHASWRQFYGVCILCGIGFTMSLFIGLLAFEPHPLLQDEAKIGVLLGSALSALVGLAVLSGAKREKV